MAVALRQFGEKERDGHSFFTKEHDLRLYK